MFLNIFFPLTKMSPATEFSERQHPDTIVLFDVDGTLTPARAVSICCPWSLRVCESVCFDILSCSLFPRRWKILWPTFARRPLSVSLVALILASNMSSLVNLVSRVLFGVWRVIDRCMLWLVLEDFDFCFAENGLTAYRLGKQMASQVTFVQQLNTESNLIGITELHSMDWRRGVHQVGQLLFALYCWYGSSQEAVSGLCW